MEKQVVDLLKDPQNFIVFLFIVALSLGVAPKLLRKLNASKPFQSVSWTGNDILIVVCMFFVFANTIGLFIQPHLLENKFILLLLNGAIQFFVSVFLCFWLLQVKKSDRQTLGFCKPSAKNLGYSLGSYLTLWPIFVAIVVFAYIVVMVLGQKPEKQEIVIFFMQAKGHELWISAFIAIVLIPMFEELFFRVFLYSWLRNTSGVYVAIFVSAVCFSIVHSSAIGFIPIAALGAFFALLYEKTQSIWIPVFIHGSHNLITISLIKLGVG